MKYCYLFFLFTCLNIFSQNQKEILISDFTKNNKYFDSKNLKDLFYIHTNKSSYLKGEKIFFKAYIINTSNMKLNNVVKNLYLNVYNENKELVLHKILYAKNGVAHNSIELTTKNNSEKFYLNIDTNWNKNFPNNIYAATINIIDNQLSGSKKLPLKNNNSKFTIYPESGSINLNSVNKFYYVNNNFSNTPIVGKVINLNNNKIITEFSNNNGNTGSFSIKIEQGNDYKVILNNFKTKLPVDKYSTKNIALRKIKTSKTDLNNLFLFKASKEFIKKNNHFFFVHHQGQKLISATPVFTSKETHDYFIKYLKKELNNGVNMISVFNANFEPVIKKNFYHSKDSININSEILRRNDSTFVNLKSANLTSIANSSISILPYKTKAYSYTQNIRKSLSIIPYISKDFQVLNNLKANKYFNDNFFNTISNIYSSKEFNKKPTFYHKKDFGIDIKGKVEANLENKNLYYTFLKLKGVKLPLVCQVNEKGEFHFKNNLIYEPSLINLSLKDKKGKAVKSNFYIYKNYVNYSPNKFIKEFYNLNDWLIKDTRVNLDEYKHIPASSLNSQILDVVEIKAKKKKQGIKDYKEYPNLIANSFTKKIKINKDLYFGDNVLQVLLNLRGIRHNKDETNPYFYNQRGPLSLTSKAQMEVFLNSLNITHEVSILIDIKAIDIDWIDINKSGAGYGLLGTGGIIHVHTKTKLHDDFKSYNRTKYTHQINYGFLRNNTNDTFRFSSEEEKEYYGTIDWIPNFYLNPNQDNLIYLDNIKENKRIKIIINGVSSKGELVHKVLNVNL